MFDVIDDDSPFETRQDELKKLLKGCKYSHRLPQRKINAKKDDVEKLLEDMGWADHRKRGFRHVPNSHPY